MLENGGFFAIGFISGVLFTLVVGSLVSYYPKRNHNIDQYDAVSNENDDPKIVDDNKADESISIPLENITTSQTATTTNIITADLSFLNHIIAHVWDKISNALFTLIKIELEPKLKEVLPAPLKSLTFTKIDLGRTPIKLENTTLHLISNNTIKINTDITWNSDCDIDLSLFGGLSLGLQHLTLRNTRLSIALSPLIDTFPIVSAIQFTIIDTPSLSIDYTGLANVADVNMIDNAIRTIIVDALRRIAIVPERQIVRLHRCDDDDDDVMVAGYQPPRGILRVRLMEVKGFDEMNARGSVVGVFRDKVDVYCKVSLGGAADSDDEWKTSTLWNGQSSFDATECADFVVWDDDQYVTVKVFDEDRGLFDKDDEIGTARERVGDLIRQGYDGREGEMTMITLPVKRKKEEMNVSIGLHCNLFRLTPNTTSLTDIDNDGDKLLCGLLTVMVIRASNIPGGTASSSSSYVTITHGDSHFRTKTIKRKDDPSYYNYTRHIPLTMITKTQPIILTLHTKNTTAANDNNDVIIGTTTITHQSLLERTDKTISGPHTITGDDDDDSRVILDIHVMLRGKESSRRSPTTARNNSRNQERHTADAAAAMESRRSVPTSSSLISRNERGVEVVDVDIRAPLLPPSSSCV